jgi:uncharacterized membrane protein
MKRDPPPRFLLDFLFSAFCLSGLLLNILLVIRRFSDTAAGIAGCGGGGCEEVLASRWSSIFGVPVTVFGAIIYLLVMLSIHRRLRMFAAPALGAIAGSVVWFVFVQFVLLGKICPWCMAAHVAGLVAVLLGAIRFRMAWPILKWAAAAFLGIGLAQVYGPVPATHFVETAKPEPGRSVSFDAGRISHEVSSFPILGSAQAKHILVEYFDYQCAACQKMSPYLEALVVKHPKEVSVLLLPVPLDGSCNGFVNQESNHPGSCEITRIALALWRSKPDAYPAFHRQLIAAPSAENAKKLALAGMTAEALDRAQADPEIETIIRSNIAGWHSLSKSTPKLPKLLIRDRRILHGIPADETSFIQVMKQELGLAGER